MIAKIVAYANERDPLGCADGTCDSVTEAFYTEERERFINNCISANTSSLSLRKNTIKRDCEQVFDERTQGARKAIGADSKKNLDRIRNMIVGTTGNKMIMIVAIIFIAYLLYTNL